MVVSHPALRTTVLAFLLALPAAEAAWLTQNPLQMPQPLVLPHAVDIARLKSAILTAVTRRKWITEADIESGFVVALHVRDHVLRIRIEYESRQVRFIYVNSENLGYEIKDGVPKIHYNANRWLSRLGQEIQREVQLVVFDNDERVNVVGPSGELQDTGPGPAPAATPAPSVIPPAPLPPAAAPAELHVGGTAALAREQALRSRPMADSDAVATLAAGTQVQLVSASHNLAGNWWYVNAGRQVGWLLETGLRPLR